MNKLPETTGSNEMNKTQRYTVPSLSGTLAKRTKPMLNPNFAKEPFRLSRSNVGMRNSTNLLDIQIENKNRQCLTRSHKTCRFQWVFGRSVPHRGLSREIHTYLRNPIRFIPQNVAIN